MTYFKRIALSLITCLIAGIPVYAQQEKPQTNVKDLARTNADSIVHTQTEAVRALGAGAMSERKKYDSLRRLSAVKRKSSSGPTWSTPRVSVDTSRVKGISDSWKGKDWEFKTDGNNSTHTDISPGSLSEYKGIFKASSPAVKPEGLPEDLRRPGAGSSGKPSVKQVAQPSLEGLKEQQDTLKAQAGEAVKDLQTRGIFSQAMEQVSGAKKIYSEKQLEHLRDSLGGAKFDSLFQIASALTKKEISKEDFMGTLGQSLPGKSPLDNVNIDQQSLNAPEVEALNDLPETTADLSKVKLPQSALSELPPLTGSEVSGRYLKLVDSLRNLNLKKDRITLEEKKVTEDVSAAIVKEKPTFLDKTYFEGIVGYLKEGDLTLLQVSPSFGYHFTSNLSVGAGPSILLRSEDKNWSTSFGFRSFLKAEFFHQKVYLQLEDDVKPGRIDVERTFRTPHSILIGGGGLIPLTKKMAINPSLLYRINNDQSVTPASPWVFRLGISSIKSK